MTGAKDNDWLEGGPGADTLDDGAHKHEGPGDRISYYQATSGVTIDLSGTTDNNGYIVGSREAKRKEIKLKISRTCGSDLFNAADTLTGDDNGNWLDMAMVPVTTR